MMSTFTERNRPRIVLRICIAIVLQYCAIPAIYANYGTGFDEKDALLDKLDAAQTKTIKLLDNQQLESAFAECNKAIALLEELIPLGTSKEQIVFTECLRSEQNRSILIANQAIEKDYKSATNLPDKWRERIDAMAPPQSVDTSLDLVHGDWRVFVCYGMLQQCMALHYLHEKDYSHAHWHFAHGETYFEKYEAEAPNGMRAEYAATRQRNKKHFEEMIKSRGITQGMYVQNNGLLQNWIGRVLEVDGDNITARLTYASDQAPRGFIEGETVTLRRDEIKPMRGLSFGAALKGYK